MANPRKNENKTVGASSRVEKKKSLKEATALKNRKIAVMKDKHTETDATVTNY